MHWYSSTYLLPLVLTAGLAAALAIFAWRRRSVQGAFPFSILMLAVAAWSLAYAFELASPAELGDKERWDAVEFIGIVIVPAAWLSFALEYTRQGHWLTKRNLVLLAIEPVLTVILVWTNRFHGLIWSRIWVEADPVPTLGSTAGPAFLAHTAYSYVLLILGMLLLVQHLFHAPRLYRGQVTLLIVGALVPWVANALPFFGLSPFPSLDLTPYAFTVTAVTIAWSLFGYRLLDIVPVARDAAIEDMRDGALVLDALGRIVDLNPAAAELLNSSATKLVGKSLVELQADRPEISLLAAQLTSPHHATEWPVEIILNKGAEQRCLEPTVSPLYDRHRHPSGHLIVLRDVSERKRTETALLQAHAELEQRNRQLAQILETGNSMRVELDLPALLQQIVESAHQALGYEVVLLNIVDQESGEVRVGAHVGMDEAGQQIAPETVCMTWPQFSALLEGLEPRFRWGRCYYLPHDKADWLARFEGPQYRPTVPDAAPLPSQDAWHPDDALFALIEFPKGQIAGLISLDRPSDGKRPNPETLQALEIFANQAAIAIENAGLYKRLRQELVQRERAAEELRQAKEEAEAASRTKSTFLANISHEVRTPLTAIIGYSELLQQEARECGQEGLIPDLERIRVSGSHLLNLINGVLDLSKIEAGRLDLLLERFDIARIVDDVTTTVRPLVERNRNTLDVHLSGDLGTMVADAIKVRQVLINLLGNAAKFTEEGSITLTAVRENAPQGDRIVFKVTDTGIGMSPTHVQNIFEPFTQADDTIAQRYGGTGLGLAISYRFCQLMGGEIAVESEEGQGSTFTVRLPAQVATPIAPLDDDLESKSAPAATPATILLLGVDPATDGFLRSALGGAWLTQSVPLLDAIAQTRERRPRAVLLNVLAEKSSWQTLRQLKADPESDSIPIVLLAITSRRGLFLGLSDCLTHPIDPESLRRLLHRHRRTPLVGEDLHSHALVVEPDPERCALLQRALQQEGWEVAAATKGANALLEVVKKRPDLILFDLSLLETDQFRFITELGKFPAWRSIPIAFLLNQGGPQSLNLDKLIEQALLRAGSSSEELAEQVRELLDALR